MPVRLLHTSELCLHEFDDLPNLPPYAILSHTWNRSGQIGTHHEVTVRDIENWAGEAKPPSESLNEQNGATKTAAHLDETPPFAGKKGYSKLIETCCIAKDAKYDYLWADTFCVDAAKSDHVKEAINVCKRLYAGAGLCVAYLSDLPPGPAAALESSLQHCAWFTRGWTLSELVFSREISFYDQGWNLRGRKSALLPELARITGVPIEALETKARVMDSALDEVKSLSHFTIAQRMSWMTNRTTSRPEDMAYCLLGIFDVRMTPTYGEGRDLAFNRLLTKIMKTQKSDLSILSWCLAADANRNHDLSGVLAPSPHSFLGTRNLTPLPGTTWPQIDVYNVTLKLRQQLLLERHGIGRGSTYLLRVGCIQSDPARWVAIRLRKIGDDRFVRADPCRVVEASGDDSMYGRLALQDVHLEQDIGASLEGLAFRSPRTVEPSIAIAHTRYMALQLVPPPGVSFWSVWPASRWDYEDYLFFINGQDPDCGACLVSFQGQHPSGTQFYGMFFATGWNKPHAESLQCTIIDYAPHTSYMDRLIGECEIWNFDTSKVLKTLHDFLIPKTSFVTFLGSGQPSDAVIVRYSHHLVSDQMICPRNFWRMEFEVVAPQSADVPMPTAEPWRLGTQWQGV